MDKRISRRFPVNIEIYFYLWSPCFWEDIYKGTIKNLSLKGVYLHTKALCYPPDALLEIYIPFAHSFLCIPVKSQDIVWKRILSDNVCNGMGIELSNPPKGYIAFIESLKIKSWH